MVFIGWICLVRNMDFPFLYQRDGRGYLSFFLGVLLHELHSSRQFNGKNISRFLLGAVLLLLGFVRVFGMEKVFGIHADYGGFSKVLTFFVWPTCLLASLNLTAMKTLFRTRPLQLLGKLSMSVFFSHGLVLFTLSLVDRIGNCEIHFESRKIFCVTIALVFTVAVLWHVCVEKKLAPFMVRCFEKLFLRLQNE